MVKWVYEELESSWCQISGVVNLGSSSPSLTYPDVFTIFIHLLCLAMLGGSESYCLTNSKYETDISSLKLYEESAAYPNPQGTGALFISLFPGNMYSNTLMSRITQGSLERTNPQSCWLEVQALPNSFKISDLASICWSKTGYYQLILYTSVKGAGKKTNHMKYVLRIATVIAKGKRDIQYISFRCCFNFVYSFNGTLTCYIW